MNHYIHYTPVSGNQKTGPILVTTTSAATCPASCPLKNSGCYAQQGHLAIHWRHVTSGTRNHGVDAVAAAVGALPPGSVWRHCQAGDQLGDGKGKIDRKATMILAKACSRTRYSTKTGTPGVVRCLTYTHYPPTPHNLRAIRAAAAEGMVINLSADTPGEADEFARHGVPVVTIVPSAETTRTPEGRKIFMCPAQMRGNVTCATCKLCANNHPDRPIIGFLPHGTGAKRLPVFADTATPPTTTRAKKRIRATNS